MVPPFFNSFDDAKFGVTNLGTGGPEARNFDTIYGRAESLIIPYEYFLLLENCGCNDEVDDKPCTIRMFRVRKINTFGIRSVSVRNSFSFAFILTLISY